MKTNARGDELGPGGRVERKRNEVMSDYYKLNTPVATDSVPKSHKQAPGKKDLTDDWIEPAVTPPVVTTATITEPYIHQDEPEPEVQTKPLRGTLAGSVAKTQPTVPDSPTKKTGPSRI